MPDRILRAGILTSKAVNTLTFPAEVFYRRLMSVVDDFGRCEADPELLRSTLYPRKLSKVSEPEIVKWLAECAATGLLRCYTVAGQQYLELAKFGQRLRAARSKWPPPPDEAGGGGDPPSSADICPRVPDGVSDPPSSAAVFVFGDGVETPLPPSCGQLRPPWRWWESVKGVREKAKELGLRDWDEAKAQQGEDVAWPLYRKHVLDHAGDGPWREQRSGQPTALKDVLKKAG